MPRYRTNRTKRLREKLVKHLGEEGPKSSRELLDFYNRATKQGTTMNSMTNVLSKDPRFVVVETIRVSNALARGAMRSRYDMLVWDLAPDIRREEE
tara:strand:+ start:181 stop:468 length:288 start_codon:yes stop_codon:yes gene_type:complete